MGSYVATRDVPIIRSAIDNSLISANFFVSVIRLVCLSNLQQNIYNWRAVTSLLMVKFLAIQFVAKKPYFMKNTEVDTYPAGSLLLLKCQYVCIYNLTDDETFELWDSSNLIFATFTKQK